LFPANLQYITVYIKNLLLIKRYDDAESIIKKYGNLSQNRYFQAQLTILRGILYEKKYNNQQTARRYYLDGLRDTAPYGVFAGEFNAYAYFGLSRISDANQDKQSAKEYRKEALKQADYENVNFDN